MTTATPPTPSPGPAARPDDRTQGRVDTRRMNFFTGFITTAQDWIAGQRYYMEKDRRPLRLLYTPGVVEGLEVEPHPSGGRRIRVRAGAALDPRGNLIELKRPLDVAVPETTAPSTTLYVTLEYAERDALPMQVVEEAHYQTQPGAVDEQPTRIAELVLVRVSADLPGKGRVRLARLDVDPGKTAIARDQIDSDDRDHAQARNATWSGLPRALQDDLVDVMRHTRATFAELERRYPEPALADVRSAALHLELGAATLAPVHMAGVLRSVAEVERSATAALASAYPHVTRATEYADLQAAVDAFHTALPRTGSIAQNNLAALLGSGGPVAQAADAARALANRSFPPPTADAGLDQTTVAGPGGLATVTLDASRSNPAPGQTIKEYRWEKVY